MRASYRDRASAANRPERGTGTLRQRRPGVWEVRVVVGSGPARGRSIQRSFTVHGNAALAGRARRELVAEYGSARSHVRCTASAVTVGELLRGYLGSAQLWKPATVASHHHVVSTLAGDPLCRCRLQALTPAVMRAAICRWLDEGVSVPKVSARWLLIRSAVSWAVADANEATALMRRLRDSPPSHLAGFASTTTDPQQRPGPDRTDALIFTGGDDDTSVRVVVRPSGTEPKLKCYLEVRCTVTGDLRASREQAGALRDQLVSEVQRW